MRLSGLDYSSDTLVCMLQLQMNRPFGAVDVSANLKGAVPKTATQKILLALAEKGEVTQKVYGECLCLYLSQRARQILSRTLWPRRR